MSQEPDEDDLPDAEPEPAPGPPVPWTGADLLLVVVVVLFTWLLSATAVLGSGFFAWVVPDAAYLAAIHSAEERKAAQATVGQVAGPAGASLAEPAFYQTLGLRLELWARALVFPFQLVLVPLLVLGRHPGAAAAFGATWAGWRRAVVLALVGWAVLTPVVLGLNELVTRLYSAWMALPPEEHSLVLLTRTKLLPVEWVFWGVLAVVAAPLLEEFFFRGLLQGYVLAASWRGYLVMGLALFVAQALNGADVARAADSHGWAKLDAYMPVLFMIVLGVGFLVAMEYARSTRLPGYLAVSMLFAAVHSTWPQPVALFVLSLGLCCLRDKSGSLLTPVLVHALFNGTSSVLYFYPPW